ncbi:MAG: hypothetical protein FWD60_06870 [Candidatus Azobacteroides sp.]|nr:hypothetical protein [Candidatus Azobacteroides sp.]
MMTFDNESIYFLKRLDEKGWYNILDKIFNYEQLPSSIAYTCDYISSYFLELNDTIVKSQDVSFLYEFHTILIKYYFDLPTEEAYFSRIYTLHWILGNIKPKVELIDKFYNQLFLGTLNNLYYDGLHLHSSLLSMIHELPSICENTNITTYLFGSINQINDYSFFGVALRYFIEKKSINDYWNYFYQISYKYKNKEFANILTESLMDLRSFSGSFQELYKKISNLDDDYKKKYPELFEFIINDLDQNYLRIDGKWYNCDIYAKLLKCFINSYDYPPLPLILIEAWNRIEDKTIRIDYILILFRNREKWKSGLHIDSIGRMDNYSMSFVINVSQNETKETDPLVLINTLFLNTFSDNEIFDFYHQVYHIQNRLEIIGKNPPLELQNLIIEEELKNKDDAESIQIMNRVKTMMNAA